MRVLCVQLSSLTLIQLGQTNAPQFLLKLAVCHAGLPRGSIHLNMQQRCVLLHEFIRFLTLILLLYKCHFQEVGSHQPRASAGDEMMTKNQQTASLNAHIEKQ